MTRRAVDRRRFAFQVLNLFEVLTVYSSHHRSHVARDLFRWFVVFLPGAWNVTVCAGDAERTSVAQLHNAQHATRGHALEELNVFENSFGGNLFFSGYAFSQFGQRCRLIKSGVRLW